jgi:YVTN family beta-propeller protein
VIEDRLQQAARALHDSVTEVDVVERLAKLKGRRRQQRAALVALGAVLAVAVFAAGVAVGASREHRPATTTWANPAARPGVTGGSSTPPPGRVAATIPVPGHPGSPAVGEGGVWVPLSLEHQVVRIDPATSRIVTTIAVPRGPSRAVVASGAVWVLSSVDQSVSRIDPATNAVVRTIPVGHQPVGIAFAAGTLWVANSLDDTVMRIDPASGKVLKTIPVASPIALAATGTTVWVTGAAGLSRIDPATNQVIPVLSAASGCCGELTATSEGVWTINGDGALLRLDPTTAKVVATTPLGRDPFPFAIAATHDSVWVASAPARRSGDNDNLWRVDLAHNTVAGVLAIGPAAYGKPPNAVAASGSQAVWVAKGNDQTVLRLQPQP